MNDYDISGMTDEEKAMPKYTYGHRIPYEWVDDVITTLHQYQKAFEDIKAELEKDVKKYNQRPEISYDTAFSDGIDHVLTVIEKHDPLKAGKVAE